MRKWGSTGAVDGISRCAGWIARGGLECLFGIVCLARGTITFQQGGFGIIVAALITVAYLALYPRTSTAGAAAEVR